MDEITIASKTIQNDGRGKNKWRYIVDKTGYELIIVETWEIIILSFLLLSMFEILQNQIIKNPSDISSKEYTNLPINKTPMCRVTHVVYIGNVCWQQKRAQVNMFFWMSTSD